MGLESLFWPHSCRLLVSLPHGQVNQCPQGLVLHLANQTGVEKCHERLAGQTEAVSLGSFLQAGFEVPTNE